MNQADIDFFIDSNDGGFRSLNAMRHVAAFVFLLFVIFLPILTVVYGIRQEWSSKFIFLLLYVLIFGDLFLYLFLKRLLSKWYKKNILRKVCSIYNIPLDYQAEKGVDIEVLRNAGFAPSWDKDLTYKREDMFFGRIGETEYALSEFKLIKKKRLNGKTHTFPLLEGAVMVFNLPMHLVGSVTLQTEEEDEDLSQEDVPFLSQEFLDVFCVSADSVHEEAFPYLFPPDLQRLLLDCVNNLRELCGEEAISFVFKENYFLLLVETEQDRFEVNLFKGDSREKARQDLLFLYSTLTLAKNLDVILSSCQNYKAQCDSHDLADRESEDEEQEDFSYSSQEEEENALFSQAERAVTVKYLTVVSCVLLTGLLAFFCYRTFWQGIVYHLDFLAYFIVWAVSLVIFMIAMLVHTSSRNLRFDRVLSAMVTFLAVLMVAFTNIKSVDNRRLLVEKNGVIGFFDVENFPGSAMLVVTNPYAQRNAPCLFVGIISKNTPVYQAYERVHPQSGIPKSFPVVLDKVTGFGRLKYKPRHKAFSGSPCIYIGNVKMGSPDGYGLMLLENGAQVEGEWHGRSHCENCVYRTDSYTLYGTYDLTTTEYLRCMMVMPDGKRRLRLWNGHRFQLDPDAEVYWYEWNAHVAEINHYVSKNRPLLNDFQQRYKQIYEKYKAYLN